MGIPTAVTALKPTVPEAPGGATPKVRNREAATDPNIQLQKGRFFWRNGGMVLLLNTLLFFLSSYEVCYLFN